MSRSSRPGRSATRACSRAAAARRRPSCGTSSPEDVGNAVVRAIERNAAEIDVASLGLRVDLEGRRARARDCRRPHAADLRRTSIGTGRSADVFEHGAGEVLRRYRRAARHRARGGRDGARPRARLSRSRRAGAERHRHRDGARRRAHDARRPRAAPLVGSPRTPTTLAHLHEQLHEITAPAWLPAPLGEGTSLLHLDLHPDNVILAAARPGRDRLAERGRAARQPPDVAHTWIVMACSVPTTGTVASGARRRPGGRAVPRRCSCVDYDRAALIAARGRGRRRAGLANRDLPAARAGGDRADGAERYG